MKLERNTASPSQILASLKIKKLPRGLKIAESLDDIKRIEDFREGLFSPLYPGITDFHDDIHDAFSLIAYTENKKNRVTSSVRIVFDSPSKLPADEYAKTHLDRLRKSGLKLAELSRFAISDEARDHGLLPVYYHFVHSICADNGIDSMIIIINSKSVNFHKKRIGAKMLIDDIGHNYGRDDLTFSCMEWPVAQTKPQFFKWVGVSTQKEDVNNKPKQGMAFSEHEWNEYSRLFASVSSRAQQDVYIDASQYLSGKVIDLGCGPARLAAYLADNKKISHYAGIEYARSMVEIANFTLGKLSRSDFIIRQQKIEELNNTEQRYDSAVSLQSYYAWDNPEEMLIRIYNLLLPGSVFVLATVNGKLDQVKLFKDAEKELMWHPDFEAFREYNMKLANKSETHYISMSDLISQLQSVGFEVAHCHQRHYAGGLNFLVCNKPV